MLNVVSSGAADGRLIILDDILVQLIGFECNHWHEANDPIELNSLDSKEAGEGKTDGVQVVVVEEEEVKVDKGTTSGHKFGSGNELNN